MSEERTRELRERLGAVKERISRAAAAAARDPADVRLVVVTKYFPVDDVRRLLGLGVKDIAENKDQEASAKVAELSTEERAGLRLHFVGQLQSNKAAHVATYADVVHSVDRPKIVRALARGADRARCAGRGLPVFLQVDLDGSDAGRGGVLPGEPLAALVDAVRAEPTLELRGVMAVAPRGADPAAAFARLQELAQQVREAVPSADQISAGMSGDLEQAIAAGATHIRVGSAILGTRPSH